MSSQESPSRRDDFIVLADVRRIEKSIEAETIRLDRDDGKSIEAWVERLRTDGSLLEYKSLASPAPPGSGLQHDVYFLAVQTEAQRKVFERLGSNLVCIDGTHNTTMYENLILTTLLVRDEWGHGFPVAWLLASSGTRCTLYYFLYLVRKRNPLVILRRIMTDRDLAQINACSSCYPEAAILLCWWHVLHAWQQHFHISDYPELWTMLKGWVNVVQLSY